MVRQGVAPPAQPPSVPAAVRAQEQQAMELLLERLKKTKNNVEFLLAMNLKE